MKKQTARKPFVEPKVIEQGALTNVTLISGGGGGTPT